MISTFSDGMVRLRSIFLLMFVSVCDLQAQMVNEKLIAQAELNKEDLRRLVVFDTLSSRSNMEAASIDTTVVLSGSILYTIIGIGDASGTSTSFYLLSFDRVAEKPICFVYLHDSPDIEQALKRYRWVDHGVWGTGEVGTIEYDCRVTHQGTLHERTSMQAVGRRFWRVGIDGRVVGGELEKLK